MNERSGEAIATTDRTARLAVGDIESLLAGGAVILRHRADPPKQRLRQALSQIDPRSPVALRLRIRLAGDQSYRAGEGAEMLALLDEARAVGDPVARAEALSVAHHSLLGPGNGELRRTLAVDLIAESLRTGRRGDLLLGVLWQTIDMFLDADARAGRRLGELRELLNQSDHPAVGYVVGAIEVMLEVRAGDFDRAESLAQACARRGAAAGYVGASGLHAAQLIGIRWYQGRVGETVSMLAKLRQDPAPAAPNDSYLAALAVAAAAAGDRTRATGALTTLCGRDLGDLPRSSSWLTRMNAIVEAAHLLDDASISARAYELLAPYAHLPMVGSLGAVCFGSVHHALAVASFTTGRLDRAVEHLDMAIQQNRAIGHRPAVVASRRRLAQVLTRRGRPGDRVEAQCQEAAAARDAGRFGAAPACAGRAPASRPLATCVRDGRDWLVTLGDRRIRVGHRVGMLHLAVLLANPGREIDAVDLVAGPSTLAAAPSAGHSRQPLLDQVAIRDYRQRLAQLREQIDDLEARRDIAAADRARAEQDWLSAELGAAAGLGARTRSFPTNRERARIAAGKAIRRALINITVIDPIVGEHLARTVHTGARCCYLPR